MTKIKEYDAQRELKRIAEEYGVLSLLANFASYVENDPDPWDGAGKEYMVIEAKRLMRAVEAIQPSE